MSVQKINELNIHENPSTNEDAFDVENYLNVNFETILDVVDNNADELITAQTTIGQQATNISNLQTATQTNTSNIASIQTEQTTQNNNITTLQQKNEELEEENERLKEDLKNSTVTVSGTGESVTLNNTAKATLKDIGLSGNSKQNGTPTTSEPIDINSAGDNGSITEKIVTGNLFDKNTTNILKAYIDAGRLIVPYATNTITYIRIPEGTTVSIKKYAGATSITLGTSKNIPRVQAYVNNYTATGALQTTFTMPAGEKYLIIFIQGSGDLNAGYTVEDVLNNLQINFGNTINPLTTHEEQNHTIPCQQPMRAIGDVRDTFIKENGIWYERHNIGRHIFTGNETFLNSVTIGNTTRYIIQNSGSKSGAGLCNSYKYLNSYTADEEHFYVGTNQIVLFDNEASSSGFKAKITELYNAGTPVYADYQLTTPVDLECTQEQVTAIESLLKAQSYEEQTNIYSEDEVSAIVDVKAYGDLNAILSQNNS